MAFQRVAFITAAAVAGCVSQGWSQRCTVPFGEPDVSYCNSLIHTAYALQPRAGIGLATGNPVPGASSTLGMRIGSVPRITFAGRVSGVTMDVPRIRDGTGDINTVATSLNFDAAVGLFSGVSLAPTVGGFASIDIVGSAGKLFLPDQFAEDPASWALGARVGILRESFTAPGISITGTYRRIGAVTSDLLNPAGGYYHFAMTDNSALGLRAVIGKRLFVLGAAAGVGYDSYRSDVLAVAGAVDSPLGAAYEARFSESEHQSKRFTAFANVTWTMLILNLSAEAGYQRGGDPFTAPLPSGQRSKTENARYYGSIALRLVL